MVSDRPDHRIETLRREAKSCQACPFGKTRPRLYSERVLNAEIMFVGEHLGTGKTLTVVHSSGLRDSCWTGLSLRRA